MANRIKIRHGSTTPSTNDLLPYELGWDGTNLALYINNNGTRAKIGGEGLFLPLTGGILTDNLIVQKAGDAYVIAKNTSTNNMIYLDAGSSVNHGIWSSGYYDGNNYISNGKWLVYRDGNGDIILNGNANTATTANGLVDGTSTMSSAYNKAGLNYSDYTWLAGWNGYELRAVDKTQFAQASHTHSYLPLSGGTVTGTLTVGSSSAVSSSSHALWTTGITVHDTRFDTIGVTSLSKAINFFFSSNDMPDSNWWSGMHVAGWTGDYNAWELVGPAHNTDQRTKNLYIRVGRTSTGWGSWRALVTSSDTTSRRIFVTTSASVPSGASNGDIVLVKA